MRKRQPKVARAAPDSFHSIKPIAITAAKIVMAAMISSPCHGRSPWRSQRPSRRLPTRGRKELARLMALHAQSQVANAALDFVACLAVGLDRLALGIGDRPIFVVCSGDEGTLIAAAHGDHISVG